MLARIFMILAALFLLPHAAGATEAYHFISDVIKSLESSQIAGERIGSGDSYDILAHMRDIDVFNKYIKRADRLIKPYTKSNDEIVRGAANLYDTIYSAIIENNENIVRYVKEAFDDPEYAAGKSEKLISKISENMMSNENMWQMLMYATSMATHSLVDQKINDEGKSTHLTIMSAERKALMDQLEIAFGEGIRSGPGDGQSPLESSAAILYLFLAQDSIPAEVK